MALYYLLFVIGHRYSYRKLQGASLVAQVFLTPDKIYLSSKTKTTCIISSQVNHCNLEVKVTDQH